MQASLMTQWVKNPPANAGLGRSPWRREWQPIPVFLPGKSHEQRSLAGYSSWGLKRVRHNLGASLIAQLVKNLPAMQETPVQFLGREDPLEKGYSWASLVAQLVKNPPAMRETWVQSLGWEDLLEKGKATHSSILAWRSPWTV